MQIIKIRIIFLFILFLCSIPLKAQKQKKTAVREPAVAGSFYPSQRTELSDMLAAFFVATKRLRDPGSPQPIAIVSPHAGYVFSGQVAAWSYAQLDPEADYRNIFIIGTSHYMHFDGASVYAAGDYITPLGKVEVNSELVHTLMQSSRVMTFKPEAHKKEHSIEVQLPFLQFHLHKPFRIVPILLGTSDPSVIDNVSEILSKYIKPGNLFILSTDFSHYPSYQDAVITDSLTARAFMSHNPQGFRAYIERSEDHPLPGEVTPMCGWPSALVVMKMFRDPDTYEYVPVLYQNSGSTKYGEKSRVVGYYSIMIIQKNRLMEDNNPKLTTSDRIHLLKIARENIEYYLRTGKMLEYDESVMPDILLEHRGAFVTLHEEGALRGCIGRFLPDQPLYKVIQEMAIAAAVKDPRFKPLDYDELEKIDIEISVLSPLRKIESTDEIVPGRDGILIRKGSASGTYLPQVANETGWSVEELLGHCARDKAGLGWDGWKGADLYVYTADIFSEKELLK